MHEEGLGRITCDLTNKRDAQSSVVTVESSALKAFAH